MIVLAVLFTAFILLVVHWANSGTLPYVLGMFYHIPFGDKAGHFLLLGILAFLINGALRRRKVKLWHWTLLLGTVAVAAFGTLEELSQFFNPLRTPDLLDWTAGMSGILLGDLLVRALPALKGDPHDNRPA